MILLIILAVLLGLIVLTTLVSGLIVYFQFARSPEKRWKDQVAGLWANAQRRAWAERDELSRLGPARVAKLGALESEAVHAYLAEIAVDELEAYPGIGPATVSKLRTAGYANLAALRNARLGIPGLGQKRTSDIYRAIRDLAKKAETNFAAQTCSPAQALAERRARLTAEYDALEARARSRAVAVQRVLTSLQKQAAAARQVTFWRWLRPKLGERLLPPEIMAAALPDLATAVHAANAAVAQAQEVEQPALPGKVAVPSANGSPGPTREDSLGVLEITPETPLSVDLVRRQWNLLCQRFDPDKVRSMGPEFIQLAESKLAAVRRAAESLLGPMGAELEPKPAVVPPEGLRDNPDLDDVFGRM
jgi:hypothetical protein